ncbi:hypothetical protein IIW_01809 [Bacillus cereus VD136]|nr:hypothetical protein IIW_01809 [Bacillus cereus VD136]
MAMRVGLVGGWAINRFVYDNMLVITYLHIGWRN